MHYYAKVIRSEGVYQASFPDLPNVNTFGETLEEALENASEAMNGVLARCSASGWSWCSK